jgi:hypothetical protein
MTATLTFDVIPAPDDGQEGRETIQHPYRIRKTDGGKGTDEMDARGRA